MSKALKERFARGEPVITVNLGGANPDTLDMLARFGAHLAMVDCERTGLGLEAATDLLRAARAAGIPAVVRSWSPQQEVLVQYLDRKASGLIVPRIESAAQAKAVVETVKYACQDAAERLVILQIESRAGIAQAKAIAAVPGVDAILIGPTDLAYDMTGQKFKVTDEVHAALDGLCATLREARMPFGMPVNMGDYERFKARGATLVYYPLYQLVERGLAELKQRLGA